MIASLKTVARLAAQLVALVLLITLATAGLAVAVFSIQGGSEDFSLPELSRILSLPALEDSAGDLFTSLEASGPIALLTITCSLATIAVALLLLLGVLSGREERLFIADESEEGTLVAKRRPLASIAVALAEQARGVTGARASATPGRGGGSIDVHVTHRRSSNGAESGRNVESQLSPLRNGFALKTRVRADQGSAGQRVE